MFRKVLIADRGAIAVRVLQACRELGIATVAVHGPADAGSRAVQLADQGFDIGRAQDDRRIHLQIPALISAAMMTGADAIHPGSGPLSRDPSFAEICADYGITFIGPRPEVLARLSDRTLNRRLMRDAGLPIVPGGDDVLPAFREADRVAPRLGYPVVLKPAFGQSGATVVRRHDDLAGAYEAARQVAPRGGLYLEKFIAPSRHAEIQVLCDAAGRGVHLGEQDCSLRWQDRRLVAESPAIHLGPERRRELGELAVRGALALGYSGAGTVTFLLDPAGHFYFTGINARIRVEHSITELTCGIDLIREQIRMAAGEPLRLAQEDIRPRGHALGCHIRAEALETALASAPGLIRNFILASGPGTRVDTSLHAGCAAPPGDDPLVAKLVVWAEDRPSAIDRMLRALSEMTIDGIRTTIPLLRRVLCHPAFRDGDFDTAFMTAP